jgi:hypothetical protein
MVPRISRHHFPSKSHFKIQGVRFRGSTQPNHKQWPLVRSAHTNQIRDATNNAYDARNVASCDADCAKWHPRFEACPCLRRSNTSVTFARDRQRTVTRPSATGISKASCELLFNGSVRITQSSVSQCCVSRRRLRCHTQRRPSPFE